MASETQFTPGPWRVTGKGTVRSGDGWIGDVHWRNRVPNAHLIAAAPGLFEALVACQEFLGIRDDFVPLGALEIANVIKAALGKALGK